MDAPTDLTALYGLVGVTVLGQLGTLAFGVVKWLGSRTVSREDADKAALQSGLSEQEEVIDSLEKKVLTIERDVSSILKSVSEMSASVSTIDKAVEQRIDKQGGFYRDEVAKLKADLEEKLKSLEYQMRQDMTRSIYDATTLRTRPKKR